MTLTKWILFLTTSMTLGCGSETSESTEPLGALDSQRVSAIEGAFRALCIDSNLDNLALLEGECVRNGQIYGSPSPETCAQRAAVALSDIQDIWTEIVLSATANLNQCFTDFRISDDFCYAEFDQDLSRRLYECDGILSDFDLF